MKTITSQPPTPPALDLIPCPHCGVPADLVPSIAHPGQYLIECSNLENCPVWPLTDLHSSPEAAAHAWNTGQVR